MPKCDNCNKTITNKSPGLECCKCGKVVHANTTCSGLTQKQILAIRNSDTLEWTCSECHRHTPVRKSFIVPEEDDDEVDEPTKIPNISSNFPIDMKHLLSSISKEVQKIVQKELEPLQSSIEFCTGKIDDFVESIIMMKQKLKEMENKNNFLCNKVTHYETKISSLEQRLNESDQDKLNNLVEIAGIPYMQNEELLQISNNIAEKMSLDKSVIKSVKRPNSPKNPDVIQIELGNTKDVENWMRSAKQFNMTSADILSNLSSTHAPVKVYVRFALSQVNRKLMWMAKQQLRQNFKYIWFQNGKVLVKKGEVDQNGKDKIYTIRCEDDIINLLKN